ncbi:MAG: DUF47 domain-containing protein [Oscillospiraceae bacterium]|nr:DUF47 domain-containing protein [Oscillospiraceae bacterium]
MANKADRFYFENLSAAAECSCKTAEYLLECVNNYDLSKIKDMIETMHEYEHAGDIKKHEMSRALAKAFVTPVEREDLALISQNIDEVTDSIEEILQAFYMYQIKAITPEAVTFAAKIVESCHLMKTMLDEFVNFKKPTKLHQLIIDLNQIEEDCDVIYIDATLRLPQHRTDPLDIISWRDIYNRMENCADACEHVGDCVESVVMKNS